MSYLENPCNLIVNYLPPSLTDEEFHEIFNRVGTLKASKIIRYKNTGVSYGYGFVEYNTPEEGDRAIQTFDGMQLQNKHLKVSRVRLGKDVRATNIYISNLPMQINDIELIALFQKYGTIIQSRILTDPLTNLSRGVGFVRYATREEAERAIESMNGQQLDGDINVISVKFAEDNREKAKKAKQAMACSMNNGGMVLGQPVMGQIQMDQQPTHYACMNQTVIPQNAISQGLNGITTSPYRLSGTCQLGMGYQSDTGGGPMRSGGPIRQRFDPMSFVGNPNMPVVDSMAEYAGGQNGNCPGGYALFVYNISEDTDERSLWQLFSPYGALSNVSVIRDVEKKVCKGYGFVTMVNLQEADNAIRALNGSRFKDKLLQVSLKQPKVNKSMVPVINIPGVAAAGTGVGGGILPMIPAVPHTSSEGCVLFVYNIGPDTDERALWNLFSPFGPIQRVAVVRAAETNVCKGFGFVTMVDMQSAMHAIKGLNGFLYNGRQLQVSVKHAA